MRDIRTTTTISTTSTSTNSTGNTIVEDEGRGKGTRLGTNVVVGNGTSSLDPNNEHDDSDNDGDNDLAEISWDGNPPLAESDVNIKVATNTTYDHTITRLIMTLPNHNDITLHLVSKRRRR